MAKAEPFHTSTRAAPDASLQTPPAQKFVRAIVAGASDNDPTTVATLAVSARQRSTSCAG